MKTQSDFVGFDGYGRKLEPISNTPPDYLVAPYQPRLRAKLF
jgi:hypothetical protein